ncbi:MAG: hypothetical protein GX807_02410 [Erysipelotrichia bacterium]|jgi:hypothetical protein|nr:hypothetical protein [Bacilli bacterium]NLB49650.1 hypothetical protein [Erysipelotrichia bacterium]
MINLYLSLAMILFSFQGFILTFQLGGINRTLYNFPKNIFENAIVLIQDENTIEIKPYFNVPNLEYYVTSYLNDNLSSYGLDYEVDFNYYEAKTKTLCRSDRCDGVKVIFKTKILTFYPYEKTVYYEVRENNE